MLSRHKNRSTWETQGGHIEGGESLIEAAGRELYEESGAVKYLLSPASITGRVMKICGETGLYSLPKLMRSAHCQRAKWKK